MPQWSDPPDKALKDALHGVMQDLEDQVSDNPAFEEVVGLPMEKLVEHGVHAVTAFIARDQDAFQNPEAWIQIYCLGFVVGMKYGEQRKKSHSPPG